jgi:DNA-binding transcriptional regulator YdaS (Cro superfamily)
MRHYINLVAYFIKPINLARALGVSKQTVNHWLAGKRDIPMIYTIKIEQITNGKIKAITLINEKKKCYLKNI